MRFLTDWNREIEGIQRDSLSKVQGNNSLLLISPSLKVFEVKVSDAGALTVTKVAG